MLETVIAFFGPQPESKLERLRKEALEALIAENERLVAACAEARVDYNRAAEPARVCTFTEPVEQPSLGFSVARAVAERRTGSTMTKFFGG